MRKFMLKDSRRESWNKKKRTIEEEKNNLKQLQLPPKVQPSVTENPTKGEKIHDIIDIIACSIEKSGKALQIVNFLWPEPIPQYQTITLVGDMEFRVGKKKTLDKITMEECGFGNMRILQELLKHNTAIYVNTYLNYTADIFRLASKLFGTLSCSMTKSTETSRRRKNLNGGHIVRI
ncbi:unnamed protein product [Mytilus coruscus]|uniref:Uncharacterized protein n=1 Tax=Mytilus coruscus TaxID=42192 RepID=A0A6J8E656_MYTCO|nr:unnamed protein product [Mytilus coruscus]